MTVRGFTTHKHLAEKLISDLQRRRDLEAAPQARKFCGFLDTKSRFSLFFTLWNALRWLLGKATIEIRHHLSFEAHYQSTQVLSQRNSKDPCKMTISTMAFLSRHCFSLSQQQCAAAEAAANQSSRSCNCLLYTSPSPRD